MSTETEELLDQVVALRQDAAFMDRLRERIEQDGPLLDRLRSIESQVRDLPMGLFVGANRYDTDDQHTLHLWTAAGQSYDVIWPKR